MSVHACLSVSNYTYKKLIRRWDSEREPFLRRHRTILAHHSVYSKPEAKHHKYSANVTDDRQTTDGRATT